MKLIAILFVTTLVASQSAFAMYLDIHQGASVVFRNVITDVQYINSQSDPKRQMYTLNVCSWGDHRGARACCLVRTKSLESALEIFKITSSQIQNAAFRCVTNSKIDNIAAVDADNFWLTYDINAKSCNSKTASCENEIIDYQSE